MSITCGDDVAPFGGGGGLENAQHLLLNQLTQTLATPLTLTNRVDDLTAGCDANICHQQQFFQRIGRINIDLPRTRLRRSTESDHFVETI